jgi:ketosteroid isomerase-like protein
MAHAAPSSVDAVLDPFFAAITRGDVETIAAYYAPDIQVWHNITRTALDKAAAVEVLRRFTSRVHDIRYEVLERFADGNRVVQRHILHGRAPGGTLAAHVCIVFEIWEGRIIRVFEYLDGADIAVLSRAAAR